MSEAGAYDAEAVKALAKEWIDGVNSATGPSGGWRLQILRMRVRRPSSASLAAELPAAPGPVLDANGEPVSSEPSDLPAGECRELPARIRRFVPGCPWALVDQAVRYLHSIAPYTGIVYNGVRLEGAYRPTMTQWLRDDQTNVSERGANGTYTLVQDLIEVSSCDDAVLAPTGVSCSAYEETSFRWDEASVEPLPTGCEQGVTWSLRAVQRNEDGTFDYQVVKTVARSRHFGPVRVSCGELSETWEERWESLYGEPAQASSLPGEPGASPSPGTLHGVGCDFGGALPGPVCDTPGVRTEWEFRRNPDCTYDAVARRTVSKEWSASWREGSACRPREVAVVSNSREFVAAPAPEVGRTVDHRVTRNDDGSYSATTQVTMSPAPYSYGWTDGPACRRRRVDVLRAQTSQPELPTRESDETLRNGGTLEAELSRNEDCTWDARFAVTAAATPFVREWDEGTHCRREHVRVGQNEASPPPVPGRAAGKTVSYSVTRNADCTYDSRVVERHAPSNWTSPLSPINAGSACRPETVKYWFNDVTKPSFASPATGKTVRVSLSRNDDCTWNAQETVTTTKPQRVEWSDGTKCRRTAHTAWTGQTSQPATKAPSSLSAGQTVSVSVRRNEDCTYDATQELTTADGGSSPQWTEGSLCRTSTGRLWWGRADLSFVRGPGPGETVSYSVSRNPDCTYDAREVRTTRSQEAPLTWTDGDTCRTVSHTVYDGLSEIPPVDASETPGETTSASFRRNEDCTVSGEVSVTRRSGAVAVSWSEGASCRPTSATAAWGVPAEALPVFGPRQEGASVSMSVSRNADCTFDYVRKETQPMRDATTSWTSGGTCEREDTTLYSHVAQIPVVGAGTGAGVVKRASFHMNEDCTFSGQVSTVTSQEKQSSEWTDGYKCQQTTHRAYFNQRSVNIPASLMEGQHVSASVSMNADCTYNYQYAKTQFEEKDEKEITWTSTEEGPRYKYEYEHTLHLFSHVRKLPSIPKYASVDVDVRINEDCTYSGAIKAKKLSSWSDAGGGGGSGDGGIGTGSTSRTLYAIVNGRTMKRTITYGITVYKGEGNASASTLAGHQSVTGIPGGCLCTDVTDDSGWQWA